MRRPNGRIHFLPIQRGRGAVVSNGHVIPRASHKRIRAAGGNGTGNRLTAVDELELQITGRDPELETTAACRAVGADNFLVWGNRGGPDQRLNGEWRLPA